MRWFIPTTNYTETIQHALELKGEYNKSVLFHCYWNGNLNEKHLYSILSCYFFNVHHNKHKLVLWVENNTPNQYNDEISKYADIKPFSLSEEKKETKFLEAYDVAFDNILFYSDFVRSLLLYNYGGVWFDLDCLFTRNFDPLFCHFEHEICLYEWGHKNYPNNAIYMSLHRKSEKMKQNMEYIVQRNLGWSFFEVTYDLPLDILVLPCSWFDADWIQNPYNIGWVNFFKNTEIQYSFETFFKGSFCYHWHNQWDEQIEENSIFMQLIKHILTKVV